MSQHLCNTDVRLAPVSAKHSGLSWHNTFACTEVYPAETFEHDSGRVWRAEMADWTNIQLL